jgi:dTDP-4-dehydrorhamnose reductase
MKVIVFGSTGMLGNYVTLYLSKYYTVIPITRKQFDVESENWGNLETIINEFSSDVPEKVVIVNCAGAIPQQGCSIRKFITLNTLFPHKLHQFAQRHQIPIIHITTDCVFSGREGGYDETSIHDAQDIYGISKSLGENQEMCIIRTSIIGEEMKNKTSLLEFVKSKRDSKIFGFTNVLWNGITCYQLAKIIQTIIARNGYWKGVRHIHSPDTVSKYELCSYINDIYNLNIDIQKEESVKKNMTIKTIHPEGWSFHIPSIHTQIMEQYMWLSDV